MEKYDEVLRSSSFIKHLVKAYRVTDTRVVKVKSLAVMNMLLKIDKERMNKNFGRPNANSSSLAEEIANQGLPTTHVNDLHDLVGKAEQERNHDGFLRTILWQISFVAD